MSHPRDTTPPPPPPLKPRDPAVETLRDKFAIAAITGTLPGAAIGDERVKEYAQWAYKMADAMLAERVK